MLAWGKKVPEEFRNRVREVARTLGTDVNHLMACMAFESGETFSPSIRNAAGSGAVGLIQFMPSTAGALGTTTEALAAMTAVQQLKYVEKYFKSRKGKLHSLEDVYMAILWPAAIGKPDDYVLFAKEPLNKYQKWLYSVYTNRLQTETRPLSPFFIAHGAMFAPFGVL